mmetsp:Transcript_42781/g.87999  ORF Transcript_42781/g.87999 Transcript_42781/m.87999 type:complete len:110 (+) Transcript_42781:109-438(+)
MRQKHRTGTNHRAFDKNTADVTASSRILLPRMKYLSSVLARARPGDSWVSSKTKAAIDTNESMPKARSSANETRHRRQEKTLLQYLNHGHKRLLQSSTRMQIEFMWLAM